MPRIRFALGVSSRNAASYTDDIEAAIRQTAQDKRKHVLAIGRCGLADAHDQLQASAFERQASLARELDLPLIVEGTGSLDVALDILKSEGLPARGVLLSGFADTPEELAPWCDAGAWVSFDARAADDPVAFSRLAQAMPANRLLVESGAPEYAPRLLSGYDARADQVVFAADALMGCAGPGVFAENFKALFEN